MTEPWELYEQKIAEINAKRMKLIEQLCDLHDKLMAAEKAYEIFQSQTTGNEPLEE